MSVTRDEILGGTAGYVQKELSNGNLGNTTIFNNGTFVGFNTTTPSTGAGYDFEAVGPLFTVLGVGKYFTSLFNSTDSYDINKGGGISFGGKYNSSGDITPFGGISAVKLNATDGNYQGRLNLWVRDGSAGVVAMTTYHYGSKARTGFGTINPTAQVHIDGDNEDALIVENKCINVAGYAAKLLANTVNTQNNIALFAQATNGLKNYAAVFEGNINTNIPVGNTGLASGDLYVDTAANILANGDYVVGRKV